MFIRFLLSIICVVAFVAAQLPTFPDNIIAFTNTDIINTLGFNGANPATPYTGRKMHVTLVRNIGGFATVVGEAFPTVSGKVIAFDINHPFGYCWGYGSNYQVTPDVLAGDQIIFKMDGVQIASSTVLPVKITSRSLNNNVVTMSGTGVSSLPDPTFLDCRIVQPALVNTIVGRRDVRAIPGANFPKAVGYASSLTTNGDAFTCTFTFFDAANGPNPLTAESAYIGLMQVSSWLFTDAAGNAQGMTISEFGFVGGPMDGTCPPSAAEVTPIAPDAIAYDGTKAYWNAGTNIPGAANNFNFYQVEALRPSVDNAAISEINGYRTTPDVLSATFATPLATSDTLTVRAWSNYPTTNVDLLSTTKKITFAATNVAVPSVPTFSAVSNTIVNSVSLASAENLQLAYTISAGNLGVAPVLGAVNTIIYSGKPITITGTQTIVAVAFDSAGHISASSTATFTNPTPGKVVGVTAITSGLSKITVAWAPYTSSTVTGFRVYTVVGGVQTLVKIAPASPFWTDVSAGLIGGNSYSFVVTAINVVNGVTYEGPVSDVSLAPASFLQGQTDTLTYNIKYNPGNELRVAGTGTIDAASVSVIDAATGQVLGTSAVSAGTFLIRIRPVGTNVFSINLISSLGFTALNVPTA